MRRLIRYFYPGGLLLMLAIWPVLMAGNNKEHSVKLTKASPLVIYDAPSSTVVKTANDRICEEIQYLYDTLHLKKYGLAKEAFEYAWKGYKKLLLNESLHNDSVLSVCDFSQSSRKKRLYVIDLAKKKLLVNTYVAHGRRSGKEFARSFSNQPDSYKSSLGFYLTRDTYQGSNGLSLNVQGLEPGINDNAYMRRIVIHSSFYVGTKYLKQNPFSGTSLGCPAVPVNELDEVIKNIKDGSCLFIYHPSKHYLVRSAILNG